MQLSLFNEEPAREPREFIPDLHSYDYILVAFSGGKDSIAAYLRLLQLGVPPEKIELNHHRIDGIEGSKLMDWPVTDDYCLQFSRVMGSPIYYSWREGGFEREMLRQNQPTGPVVFESPGGGLHVRGGNSPKLNTRRKFPQVSADLSVRWCSAYLKIMVMNAAITAQKRFEGKRTLIITGERAEESAARAKYEVFGSHYYTNCKKRHVDHWRPVHKWKEQQVWDVIKEYNIRVHPCYYLGWNRCSCSACIFGNNDQWASLNALNPDQVKKIADYEGEFQTTIHRKLPVMERVEKGKAYEMNKDIMALALSKNYYESIIIRSGEWEMPSGAFGEGCGPT